MSKKEYTPVEVAKSVLKKTEEMLKNSAIFKAEKSKHDRCVEQVKEKSPEVKSPHAVCVSAGVVPEKWHKSEMEKAAPQNMSPAQAGELKGVSVPKPPQMPKMQAMKSPRPLKQFMQKYESKKGAK